MNGTRFVLQITVCILLVVMAGCSREVSKPAVSEAPAANGETIVAGAGSDTAAVVDKQDASEGAIKPAFYTVDHYDVARNPADDLKATVARAQAEKKNILVQVGGEWCGWCHLLSEYIETNEKVRDTILANYLVMKVTFENEQKNEAFLSQFPEISGYPHLFVLDSNGQLLHSQGTGELEEGRGYNEAVVLAFLEKWKPAR